VKPLLLFLCLSGVAHANLREELVNQHVVLEATPVPSTQPVPLAVFVESKLASPSRELLAALLRRRLSDAKVNFYFAGAKPRPVTEATAPKLVLALTEAGASSVTFELFLVEYTVSEKRFIPSIAWERKHTLDQLPESEREETLGRLLQRELAHFVARPATAPQPFTSLAGAPYRTEWRDRESVSSILAFGATAGTPIPVGLRAGVWGNVDLPIALGIGGMYLSPTQRGFQADAGWAWDRQGTVKQVVGVTFAKLNETTVVTSTVPQERSRTSTRIETTQRLRGYFGPHYVVQWSDIFFQAAALFPVQDGQGKGTRFLMQVGYVPLWF